MAIDKHTHRANALAAMRAAIACDWAAVYTNIEQQKQPEGSELRGQYMVSTELLKLQVEDEISKCYVALRGYYGQ